MNSQEALEIVNQILSPQSLSHIQELVFRHSWNQKTYKQIAVEIGYDSDYVKEIGSELWQVFSKALGRRVTKKNVQIILAEQGSRLGEPAIADPKPEFRMPSSSSLVVQSTPALLLQVADWQSFKDYLHQEWQQLQIDAALLSELESTLSSLSLILGEVDHLPTNSNAFEPEAGDVCLQAVADTLKLHLKRPKDLLASDPTGKFVILLPQTNARGAVHLAESMRVAIKQLNICYPEFPSSSTAITISLAVTTTSPNPQSTPNHFLTAGMQTLQQAKQQGGDQVIYKPV